MQNLFKRVTHFIRRSIDDPAIDQLADELRVTPEVIMASHKPATLFMYSFPSHGFDIFCQETILYGRWMNVGFSLRDSEDSNGFSGELPFGLLPTDTRLEAQRKLNITPVPIHRIPYYRRNRPDNESLDFTLGSYEAFCSFDNCEPYALSGIGVGLPAQELGDIMLALYDFTK